MNLSSQFKGLSLADQFIVPPFSVLDARKNDWIKRKRIWLEITGIPGGGPKKIWNEQKTKFKWEYVDDEMQKDPLLFSGLKNRTGKSYFDPVLCEVVYSWFTPKGATIIDPFSGNFISGIVAAKLGRVFFGIELRDDLCKSNSLIAANLGVQGSTRWQCGDSLAEINSAPICDFVFSCPPYGDLEVYSKDPRDISAMKHEDFLNTYKNIISLTCGKLRNNRFAAVLVGDFRDKNGFYRNFVSNTISVFENCGLKLYNEMILVTSSGSLANRAAFPFVSTRKVGKAHQNLLVFVKGNPKEATKYCSNIL